MAIVMEHPTDSRATQNKHTGREKLPMAFTNMWNEDRRPTAVDRLERSFTELQRVVRAYLPDKWGLVAFGITTSIVDIVEQGFQGSQVIVIDGSTDWTCFLYNALRSSYSTDMQVIHPVGVDRTMGPSTGGPAISRKRPPSHIGQHTSEEEVHNETMEELEEELDDEAEEALEDDNSELDDDGDGKESSGESL
jgi:hypothetical protein